MAVPEERPPLPPLDLTFLKNAALRHRWQSPSNLASMVPTPVSAKPALPASPFAQPRPAITQWAPADMTSYQPFCSDGLSLSIQTEVTVVDLAPVDDALSRDFAIVELPSTPKTADLWRDTADSSAQRDAPPASSGANSLKEARGGNRSNACGRLKSAILSLVLLLIVVGVIMLSMRIARMSS